MNDVVPGPGRAVAERQSVRRYVFEFGAAIAAFVLFTELGDSTVIHGANVHLVVAVILPIAAVLGMAIAGARFVARMDESQRQATLAAAAVAGVGTAFVTMALGLLKDNQLIRVDLTVVVPIFVLLFGISLGFFRLKYE